MKEVSSGLLGMKSYTVYVIHAKYESDAETLISEHRYSDFEWLDNYLHHEPRYRGLSIPRLPGKKTIGNMDPSFLVQRKERLEWYLKELGRHSKLHEDSLLRKFFQNSSASFEKVKESVPSRESYFSLEALDLNNLHKVYEYINASIKAHLNKEDDGIMVHYSSKASVTFGLERDPSCSEDS